MIGGTFLANLLALVAVPKSGVPTNAREALLFYGIPVLWAGVMLFSYRRSALRLLSYLVALPGLFWLLQVIGNVVRIIKG